MHRTVDEINADYVKYRGRCKEMSEKLVLEDPTLTLVRGFYYCPLWESEEPHWWTKKPDGTIVDPSKLQFPSAGIGEYVEFDGNITCSQCSKSILEKDAVINGNYGFCSNACAMKFVGL